jgi:hypothetical protein
MGDQITSAVPSLRYTSTLASTSSNIEVLSVLTTKAAELLYGGRPSKDLLSSVQRQLLDGAVTQFYPWPRLL